jgi:predicted O-linked N-acetylglucosamine transferase (SPINDLY family)
VNLSTLLLRLGRIDEADVASDRALQLNLNLAEGHNARGNVLFKRARFDEAVEAYRQAIAIKPQNASFHNNLASALACVGEIGQAIENCDRAIELQPGLVTADSNRIYLIHFHPDFDAESILQHQRQWARRHATPTSDLAGTSREGEAPAEPLPLAASRTGRLWDSRSRERQRLGGRLALPLRHSHANDRSPDRRLRIGYVAPEFRDHILGRYLLPLIQHHNHDAFEVACYSDTAASDWMTGKFRFFASLWRDTSALGHRELARQIHADQIDILVDTTLHMSGSRLLTFAHKPAPVQVTFAGYPGGTGLRAMDYRLTDPFLDPPGEYEDWYVEQSVRLRDTFWCYSPIGEQPPVNELPATPNGFVTFGCLNNFAKVNESVLDLWAKALAQVRDSRLLLLAPQGRARRKVIERFGNAGVTADRIEFVTHQPRDAYLRTYHRIDIGLDTFPYNGHMTSLDALWMGVPVVTRIGQMAVGRAGWSQLSNLNMTELAAHSADQFIEIVTSLASNMDHLAAIRSNLRQRMLQSPLTDAKRFAQSIEQSFRGIWQTWCACGITSSE